MIRYDSSVRVNRPPEEVFRFLVEPEKQALWSDVPMRPVTDGPFVTGKRFEVSFGMGPAKATLGLELTAVETDRLMAWRTYSGPIRWTGEYRLAADGEGTALSQQGELVFTGLWRLAEPLVGAEIRTAEIKELDKLKAAAEAS